MKCPVCDNVDLLMSERQGVEIDYCPRCRGVWLDRGELDKIIERSDNSETAPARPQQRAPEPAPAPVHYQHGMPGHHQGGYKPHKKKSLLSDLFDFD
ncbi:MAG: hypothetical protein GJT30_02605 [Geobacter sp.]|nr:hypothetical protein [Geobacter sp.]